VHALSKQAWQMKNETIANGLFLFARSGRLDFIGHIARWPLFYLLNAKDASFEDVSLHIIDRIWVDDA